MTNQITTEIQKAVNGIAVTIVSEKTIGSNGIVYDSWKKQEINLSALTMSFKVYKSVKSALETALVSMDVNSLNKWAYSIAQNMDDSELDDFTSEVSQLVRNKRDYALRSARCILNFDKPFDGLALSVAKKKKGMARDKSQLFTMEKIQKNSLLDNYVQQNLLGDELLKKSGFAYADMAMQLQAMRNAQDLIINDKVQALNHKIDEILSEYQEIQKQRESESVESTHDENQSASVESTHESEDDCNEIALQFIDVMDKIDLEVLKMVQEAIAAKIVEREAA